MEALKVEGLSKNFGGLEVLKGVSFTIEIGKRVAIIGPNGAGKTTIIQMLLTLVSPTSGDIEIFGKTLKGHREELLSMMNFTAPYSVLPYNLTTKEALKVYSLLYGIHNYRERVSSLIDEFELGWLADKKVGQLSSGEQMRIGIAKAFVNSPGLLLLDEPTASLDPAIARELRAKILKLVRKAGGAILWTSHNMREIEQVSDRIIFLSRGKIVADDSPDNLKSYFGQQDLEEIFISINRDPLSKPS